MFSSRSLQERLQDLVGAPLASVAFIHDYIQFVFDDATLTAITLPSVTFGDESLKRHQPGYCDAVCSLIGTAVRNANVNDEALEMCFENGTKFTVSLLPEAYVGPEALNFTSAEGMVVV